MTKETRPLVDRTEGEKEASEAKLRAEALLAETEARREALRIEQVQQDLDLTKLRMRTATIEHDKALEHEKERLASDEFARTYRFLGQVDGTSAKRCIDKLVQWSRLDPGCDITIIFDSPGGSIIDGFHLFDTILDLRNKGHRVTTVAQGMAASMAGILLQAGDVRIMSPQAALLIHQASFAAMGSYGKVEDAVEFIKKLQERILDIFAARSVMPRDEIKNKWERRDWWMLANEAKEHGFCDEVAPTPE